MVKALKIAQNKHGFVALLEQACREVEPPIDDVDQRTRLGRLSVRCELDQQTIPKAVERESDPDLLTLKALAKKKHTPYPLGAWLLSLEAIDAEDLQRTLQRHERPDLLSEKQLRALGLVEGLPDDVAFAYIDYWEDSLAFAYIDYWEDSLYLPAVHRNPTHTSTRRLTRRSGHRAGAHQRRTCAALLPSLWCRCTHKCGSSVPSGDAWCRCLPVGVHNQVSCGKAGGGRREAGGGSGRVARCSSAIDRAVSVA